MENLMRRPFVALKTFVGLSTSLMLLACPGDDSSSDSAADSGSGSLTSTSATPTATNGQTDTSAGQTANPTMPPDSTMGPVDTTVGDTSDTTGGTVIPPCPYGEVAGDQAPALQLVAAGCDRPLQAIGHPLQPDRLYVVEQGGNVRIVEPGSGQCGDSFLFVNVANAGNTDIIGPESGLLGFAFHPNFPEDGRVYVNYIPSGGGSRTVVEEYTVDPANPDQVDPTSARQVIEFCQPQGNHNGGSIMFDASGMLLVTTGDGGVQNDGLGNGRNPAQVLAKILRIDVEPDGQAHDVDAGGCTDVGPQSTYGIPADNPFVGDAAFAPEVYAWGFRNPWRAAIDPETQRLYVGDVGQGQWEEVTVVEAGSDHGWGDMEGAHCFGGAPCDTSVGAGQVNSDGLVLPIAEYSHGAGCSITGGAVYRSCEVPSWDGLYFYGDYCSGVLSAVLWDGATATDFQNLLNTGERLIGNGWNAWGDVYLTTVETSGNFITDGHVYRIAPGA
jgi:glucose/arabinose dehydrogenase